MNANYPSNGAIFRVTCGKRNRTDTADHLIFNVYHLFDLNLFKNVLQVMGVNKRHGQLDY